MERYTFRSKLHYVMQTYWYSLAQFKCLIIARSFHTAKENVIVMNQLGCKTLICCIYQSELFATSLASRQQISFSHTFGQCKLIKQCLKKMKKKCHTQQQLSVLKVCFCLLYKHSDICTISAKQRSITSFALLTDTQTQSNALTQHYHCASYANSHRLKFGCPAGRGLCAD